MTKPKRLAIRPVPHPGPWGAAIGRLRLSRGWTRGTAAIKAGITPTTFGRLEMGRDTKTETLRAIADAFGVPLDAVLGMPLAAAASDVGYFLADQIRDGVRAELASLGRRPPRTRAQREQDAIEQGKAGARAFRDITTEPAAAKHTPARRVKR